MDKSVRFRIWPTREEWRQRWGWVPKIPRVLELVWCWGPLVAIGTMLILTLIAGAWLGVVTWWFGG